jgi:hypothetical protein
MACTTQAPYSWWKTIVLSANTTIQRPSGPLE